MKGKAAIISPSGKFYGSEQVLFDFLQHCTGTYDVFIPAGSEFLQKVEQMGKHTAIPYVTAKLPGFYMAMAAKLLRGRYKSIYINEGGHIRYARILAGLFRKVKVTVHLRMIYDADPVRLGRPVKNIQLVPISSYVAERIPTQWNAQVVYDAFPWNNVPAAPYERQPGKFIIGIIGRVSVTKGFDLVYNLARHLDANNHTDYEFHFFGAPAQDEQIKIKSSELESLRNVRVKFMGYQPGDKIYPSIDAVAHFCLEEGLGRVYLEAIDAGKPFMGFQQGGLTEISKVFNLQQQLIPFNPHTYVTDLEKHMAGLMQHYAEQVRLVQAQKKNGAAEFSIQQYCSLIESKIN